MGGRVDLFHSRRSNFAECLYWIRDERDSIGTPEQWILNKVASGKFYAKPIQTKSSSMQNVNGVWALDENHATIETDDHIDDICRGSLVRYNNTLWMVENIQKSVHIKESQFAKYEDYKFVLSLRR